MISQKKLNLACGETRIADYFGIDIAKMDSVDAVMDLTDFPWDIESDSAEKVICNHFIEHLPMDMHGTLLARAISRGADLVTAANTILQIPNDGLILFMQELYRIMKVGGEATFETPYYSSCVAWQDPTHRRAIAENTFNYFNKGWRHRSKLDHYPISVNFETKILGYAFFEEVNFPTQKDKDFASRFYNNAIFAMRTRLTKLPN